MSAQTAVRRARYGRNSAKILRRFALRTAGSAGRSGASGVEPQDSNLRPGTAYSLPAGRPSPSRGELDPD